ncbi:hypothetical protein AXK56_20710 [Tsukamurella pulmonis]|uniref:toprim domain-containing protein n=1 Tax=Tsukamurella pulmonis TaxID=47312 RepID=UPI00079B84E7|nr:toprim domain-containing protein [Tsukamurella pulmonis]KXO95008.1 hypothetical protein AXK56_20710 [Tsukamurella pulmonis]SUP15846.1 DNA primase (bacterial type) [Tsukamurella pulmonis]
MVAHQRAFDRLRDLFQAQGRNFRDEGRDRFRVATPGHSDTDDGTVVWEPEPGRAAIHAFNGEVADVMAEFNLTWADLYDEPRKGVVYSYLDGHRVHRRPGRNGKSKAISQDPGRKGNALYGIPFPDGEPVYVVEGEGNVEAVKRAGAVATTSCGGAKSARKADWAPLVGHEVTIVRDRDAAGKEFVRQVAEALDALGVTYRVVEAAEGAHDVVDHLGALGLSLDDLVPVEPDPEPADVISINRGTSKRNSGDEIPFDPAWYPPPGAPYDVAQRLIEDYWTDPTTGRATLIRWQDAWREWSGTAWPATEDADLRARIYHILAGQTYFKAPQLTTPASVARWNPIPKTMNSVLDALAAHAHLSAKTETNRRI